MKFETVYLVFRQLTKKEQQRSAPGTADITLYGWSPSKETVKAFMQQRSKKKYHVRDIEADTLGKFISSDRSRSDLMIDALPLKSRKLETEVVIFMTAEEKLKAEQKVQKMVQQQCSLELITIEDRSRTPITTFINMILNLKPRYRDSIHYIGYRPKEQEYLFDSNDNLDYYEEPKDIYERHGISDPSRLIIYSLESIVRVLRDELE